MVVGLEIDGWELRVVAVLATGVIAAAVLSEVFWTVFFAASLAYALEPARRRLEAKGIPPKLSAGLLTSGLFVSLAALASPILFLLYRRREVFLGFLSRLPQEIALEGLGLTYGVQTDVLVSFARQYLSDTAFGLASSSPSLSLKLVLGSFLVYAALSRPQAIETKASKVLPPDALQILQRYSDRIKNTLYGLYVVQALTAALTFVVSLPVFFLLGYNAFFSLAVISGALQFIPVAGPFVVVLLLTGFELAAHPVEHLLQFVEGIPSHDRGHFSVGGDKTVPLRSARGPDDHSPGDGYRSGGDRARVPALTRRRSGRRTTRVRAPSRPRRCRGRRRARPACGPRTGRPPRPRGSSSRPVARRWGGTRRASG